MQAVKSRDTSPELAVRYALHRQGFRYRLHYADLPGSPDIVFPGRHCVVFVHGCFWHGHWCRRGARIPVTNRDYWEQKIAKNRLRDSAALAELRRLGWAALVVWECEVQSKTMASRLRRFVARRAAH